MEYFLTELFQGGTQSVIYTNDSARAPDFESGDEIGLSRRLRVAGVGYRGSQTTRQFISGSLYIYYI